MPEHGESLDGTGGVSKEVVRRLRDWVPPKLREYTGAASAWLSLSEERRRRLMKLRYDHDLSMPNFVFAVLVESEGCDVRWGEGETREDRENGMFSYIPQSQYPDLCAYNRLLIAVECEMELAE
jgi:hypothetical protein